MKPKKRHASPSVQRPVAQKHLPTMAFSAEALTVIQASFQSMEKTLTRSPFLTHPRLPFALETFTQVKQKVSAMLAAPRETLSFDGNELLIIRVCLQVYTIDLLCRKATPERNYLIVLCYHVAGLLPNILPPPIQLRD
jgi:hypothetical protein